MSDRNAAAARLYDKTSDGRQPIFEGSGELGSHDLAVGNYYTRRRAELQEDSERLEQSRSEEEQVRGFLREQRILPADADTVLNVLRDYERSPRVLESDGTADGNARAAKQLKDRWSETFETLRVEEGSEAAARALMERAAKGAAVIDAAMPSLAQRANAAGAIPDPRMVRFLAAIAPEESAK